MDVLLVCTANQCRSPMAAALLRIRLAQLGTDGVTVRSAGLMSGGVPATPDARRVVAGLDDHVSTRVTPESIEGADLVIAMARRHVQEVVARVPEAHGRTFTLKELVRRAQAAEPRRADESVAAWLGRVGAGRRITDLIGDDPADDIADPIGRPTSVYEATAAQLDGLLERLVERLWPGAPDGRPSHVVVPRDEAG